MKWFLMPTSFLPKPIETLVSIPFISAKSRSNMTSFIPEEIDFVYDCFVGNDEGIAHLGWI
jgi:hypothetical protein